MPIDYTVILRYGDKRVYQEIARRLGRAGAGHETAPSSRTRGDNRVRRSAMLASLGPVYSYQIQRALLEAVENIRTVAERTRILNLLEPRPALWHLPTLMRLFGQDSDVGVCAHAGRIIATIVRNPNWPRIETRERALEQARKLAMSPKEPTAIRETAVSVLIGRAHFTDEKLLRELGRDPQLIKFEPLRQYLVRLEEQHERWGSQNVPLE
jgi:hypothetical protein